MNDLFDDIEICKKIFLFKGLEDDEISEILKRDGCTTESFRNGDVIYSEDYYKRSLGIIKSGTVTVYSRKDAKKNVLRKMKSADVFGAASLFCNNDEYVSEITATSDVTVLFLSQQIITEITKDHRIALNYITFLSDRIRFLNEKISCFTASTSAEKLYSFMLSLPSDGDGIITADCSWKELSNRLDMGRATLYRALDELESSGRIERIEKNIKIKR